MSYKSLEKWTSKVCKFLPQFSRENTLKCTTKKTCVILRAQVEKLEDGALWQRCAEADPAHDGLHWAGFCHFDFKQHWSIVNSNAMCHYRSGFWFSGSQWESWRDRRQGRGRVQHRERKACSTTEAEDHGVLREVWINCRHLNEVKMSSK